MTRPRRHQKPVRKPKKSKKPKQPYNPPLPPLTPPTPPSPLPPPSPVPPPYLSTPSNSSTPSTRTIPSMRQSIPLQTLTSMPMQTLIISIPPPKRSFWTPFSYASTEINIFARPDFHTVCHAVYQTFYIGALFPNQNPPPITLPPLEIDKRCQHVPKANPETPKLFTPCRDSTLLHAPNIFVDITTHETPPSTPRTLTNPPDDSPWAAFLLSPKPVLPPAKSTRPGKNSKPGFLSQAPLLEVFSAKVPMTPVRARSDSPYVSTRERSVLIHPIAYAQDNGKGPQILCKAVINPPYQPDVSDVGRIIPTLTYVGFEYSDQTCLTYIPIKDTRLVYRVSCRKERWFGEEVQMIMRRSVYERIKEMSIRAYLESNPGVRVDCGNVEFQGTNVMLYVMVKANRTVRIELGNRTVYRPLLGTLDTCKHDVCGEGLMHVRFSKTTGKEAAQLKFILFGIQVTKTCSNKNLRIFEIAENDKRGEKH